MLLFYIVVVLICIVSACLIVLGIIMATRHYKELFRSWWSFLMIVTGLVIINEAYFALLDPYGFLHPVNIPLKIPLLLEWHVIALQVSMLCVIGLKSKLTRFQAIFFPSLLFLCLVAAICYEVFVGTYTPLHDWRDIILNIGNPDVKLKVALFVVSIVDTTYLLYYPFYSRVTKKEVRLTRWFWFYIFFAHLQPVTYVLYVLGSPTSGVVLAAGCVIFVVVFSIVLAKSKNPMVVKLKSFTKEQEELASSLDKLDEMLRIHKFFLNKFLTIEILSQQSEMTTEDIIKEYLMKGYANFTDYINSFRYKYYQELTKQFPNIPKEILISDAGFISKNDFDHYLNILSKK